MLVNFFYTLKEYGVPVTIGEHKDLLNALDQHLVFSDTEQFYHLARTILVKDEKYFDRYDRAFAAFSKGLDTLEGLMEAMIPDDWIRSEFLKQLSDEEKAKIESLGGLEKLIEEFKKRLEEQKERHEGGNKWIGTGGTSPFGNSGYNPEGIRVGGEGGGKSAVKVWDERHYKNLDDSIELGTRNMKVALRRLRKFAREGAADQLDLDDTISSTAKNAGLLDIKLVPEKHNAVKVLLFFDVGGSMSPHVKVCEELFSATRTEFKHLEYFYFHNYIYDYVWKNNVRRHEEKTNTLDVIRTYTSDYKVIFIGDASMSPYEVTHAGGSVEYYNEESGAAWMQRILNHFDKVVWLNPEPENYWHHSHSTALIRKQLEEQMYPLTIKGLETAMQALAK